MPRGLVLGGTGLIGRSIARRLLAAGWEVDVTGRNPWRMPTDIAEAGGKFVAADRSDDPQLRAAMGGGADLLVDCICFTADDATRLLPLARLAASTVMISSKAVYADRLGHHSNSEVPPRFDGPIPETSPTVPPGGGDVQTREGYGANKVAAEHVLLDSGLPVSVLRPSKVHGEGAARPREWVFVKRVLDRRPAVVLAHRGGGIDHTTAAVNIAALVEVVAATPGRRILNSADPDAPSALQIARTIAGQLGHEWHEVLLDDDAPEGLGRHPWDPGHPIVLDLSAAAELGYAPVGDYAATVASEIQWLVTAAREGSGQREGMPVPPACGDPFFAELFDYGAEDRYLLSLGLLG